MPSPLYKIGVEANLAAGLSQDDAERVASVVEILLEWKREKAQEGTPKQ